MALTQDLLYRESKLYKLWQRLTCDSKCCHFFLIVFSGSEDLSRKLPAPLLVASVGGLCLPEFVQNQSKTKRHTLIELCVLTYLLSMFECNFFASMFEHLHYFLLQNKFPVCSNLNYSITVINKTVFIYYNVSIMYIY